MPIPDLATGTGGHAHTEASAEAMKEIASLCRQRHELLTEPADISGYASSGLPAKSMGRGIDEDPLFFAAPLATGHALGRLSSTT